MERILRLSVVALAGLLARYAVSAEQPQDADVAAAMEQTFKWFDGLGYPGFQNRRFVSVTYQEWLQLEGEPVDPPRTFGFLLSDEDNRFKVLRLDLSVDTYEKARDGVTNWLSATYEDACFQREATRLLSELREPGDSLAQYVRDLDYDTRIRTRLFVLARACRARGNAQLAQQAMLSALAIPDHENGKRLSIDEFQKEIAVDLSHAETWRCFVDFGDLLVSREQLLGRFRWIAEHFSENQHKERVNETIELLARMVEEDKKHAAETRLPLADMPVKQRVAELIFQLRDQNGRQVFENDPCDIFLDPRGTNSPAAQLVAIGTPALEQLIESVDDDHFTRSVGSGSVLRVGECCFTIMTRISPTGRVWTTEQDRERAKREMRAWFLGESVEE
jgi:hypothetical protein